MSGGSSWRSPSTADQYQHHDYADFAQEFLNRNADYRRDHADTMARIAEFPQTEQFEQEGLSRRWGLELSPPILRQALGTLQRSGCRTSRPTWSFMKPPIQMACYRFRQGQSHWWKLRRRPSATLSSPVASPRLRLCVRQEPHSLVPAFTIPCDANCALRLAATTRFQQAVLGRRSLHDAIAMPTRNQRFRLVRLLGVHDALEAGASSRDIAFDLILPNHRPLSGAVWKGSSERRQVLRLIADARRLVTSGYRTLLLHR